jgi:hypothetical protein
MAPPDFIVVGTQKAGTTWLFECLEEHPEAFVPEAKELHFFCRPEDCRHSRWGKGLAWYMQLFPQNGPYKARGELTTDYMFFPYVVDDLNGLNPNLKIIALLRHPADRAYSQYWMKRRHSTEMPSFRRYLDENRAAVGRGFYYKQLYPYIERFGADRVRIYIYEEIKKDPQAFFADLCRFLNIDDRFQPKSLHQRVGETKILPGALGFLFYKVASRIINLPAIVSLWRFLRRNTRIKEYVFGTASPTSEGGSYARMLPEDRAHLLRIYRDENQRLFGLIGRRIDAWCK